MSLGYQTLCLTGWGGWGDPPNPITLTLAEMSLIQSLLYLLYLSNKTRRRIYSHNMTVHSNLMTFSEFVKLWSSLFGIKCSKLSLFSLSQDIVSYFTGNGCVHNSKNRSCVSLVDVIITPIYLYFSFPPHSPPVIDIDNHTLSPYICIALCLITMLISS